MRAVAAVLVFAALAAAPAWAQSTGTLQGTVTDSQNAIIPHLDGFQDQKREVVVEVAQTVVVNVKLGVGTLAENVTVSGAAPLIDTATVSVGQVMPEKTVQEIPLNGRHFVDLGPLMPG